MKVKPANVPYRPVLDREPGIHRRTLFPPLDLWGQEVRRIGWMAIGGPLLVVATFSVFAWVAQKLGHPQQVNGILNASLDVLPLLGGINAAVVGMSDELRELHFTFPTSYRLTVLRRLLLMLGWNALIALLDTLVLTVTHTLSWPIAAWSAQLIWFAPLLWVAGVGALGSLALRSMAFGCGLVSLLWGLERFFPDAFLSNDWLQSFWLFKRWQVEQASVWYLNRGLLLLTAGVCLIGVYQLLDRPEYLLRGEQS